MNYTKKLRISNILNFFCVVYVLIMYRHNVHVHVTSGEAIDDCRKETTFYCCFNMCKVYIHVT